MKITATYISYLHLCKRKLWLHVNQLTMEHSSELVAEGKLIGETSYPQRAEKGKELDLGIAKIDFFDFKTETLHEIKKSNKKEEAHKAQVIYYLYLLKGIGIKSPKAILEYPTLRIREEIIWEEGMTALVEQWKKAVTNIVDGDCPPKITKSKCKKCSYFDFCWIDEV